MMNLCVTTTNEIKIDNRATYFVFVHLYVFIKAFYQDTMKSGMELSVQSVAHHGKWICWC